MPISTWQFCDCDLFGMVSSRDTLKGCWRPPTRGYKGHFESHGNESYKLSSTHHDFIDFHSASHPMDCILNIYNQGLFKPKLESNPWWCWGGPWWYIAGIFIMWKVGFCIKELQLTQNVVSPLLFLCLLSSCNIVKSFIMNKCQESWAKFTLPMHFYEDPNGSLGTKHNAALTMRSWLTFRNNPHQLQFVHHPTKEKKTQKSKSTLFQHKSTN